VLSCYINGGCGNDAEQLRRFIAAVRDGGESPIPLQQLADSSRITLQAAACIHGSNLEQATESGV
jgi:hypothetical protein